MKITEAQLRKGIRRMIREQVFPSVDDAEGMRTLGWQDAQDGIEPQLPDDAEYMAEYHQGVPGSRYYSNLGDDSYDDWDDLDDFATM